MVLFNNPIDRQQVATLARRVYPSTSSVFMKRFERATSYPYGHLVIDLKSDTAEKDRLHTEIFDMAKTMDKKWPKTEEALILNMKRKRRMKEEED